MIVAVRLHSVTSAPFILIEPLWVWASNAEPGDSGADNCTVRSYFACIEQQPMLKQPASSMTTHSEHTREALAK
jgi:hypothetical protein